MKGIEEVTKSIAQLGYTQGWVEFGSDNISSLEVISGKRSVQI